MHLNGFLSKGTPDFSGLCFLVDSDYFIKLKIADLKTKIKDTETNLNNQKEEINKLKQENRSLNEMHNKELKESEETKNNINKMRDNEKLISQKYDNLYKNCKEGKIMIKKSITNISQKLVKTMNEFSNKEELIINKFVGDFFKAKISSIKKVINEKSANVSELKKI